MPTYKLLKWVTVSIFLLIVTTIALITWKLFTSGMGNATLISNSVALLVGLLSLVISFVSLVIVMQNKRPVITASLDFTSRYQVVQLKIVNSGEICAKNIRFVYSQDSIWHENVKSFMEINPFISILGSKDTICKSLGIQRDIDISSKVTVYVTYTDVSGFLSFREEILIDMNDFKNSLSFEQEMTKTLHDIQKLPEVLNGLTNAIKQKT
jgi:hypothetical protein